MRKAELYCNLAKYYKLVGKTDLAVWLLNIGAAYADKAAAIRMEHYILIELADIYECNGNPKSALEALTKITGKLSKTGDSLLVGQYLAEMAERHLDNNQLEPCLFLLTQCYEILSPIFPSNELVRCCDLLYRYYMRTKDPLKAVFYLSELKRIKRKLK